MKIATQNIIEEGINNTGKKYKLKARCDGRFFHFRTILTLSTLKLSVNWGKLDSTATRLRERAVTSLEVRDQTTNWYSKGKLNFGSNSVYSCTRSVT